MEPEPKINNFGSATLVESTGTVLELELESAAPAPQHWWEGSGKF